MATRRQVLRGATAGITLAATAPMLGWAGGASAVTAVDWNKLAAGLEGDLILPSDSGYAQAKKLHFSMYDSTSPAAVAYCQGAADVQLCLAFAQQNDIAAVPRSGGHSFGGFSTTTGLVIDVSRLNGIQVGGSTTVLGPGVQTVDALDALAGHGLALAGGLHGSVAAGGFVHGGGIGWQTRSFGVASDALVSAQVVLADGRVVTCSKDSEPDLFWALRGGGGGNFGIVTRYERRPAKASTMVNFKLAWAWSDVERVIEAWQQWAPTTPWTLGSRWIVSQLDTSPGAPEPIVWVDGSFLGTPEALAPLLDDLAAAVGRAPDTRSSTRFSFLEGMLDWFGCSGKTVAQCHTEGYSPDAVMPRNNFIVDRSRLFSQGLSKSAISQLLAAFTASPRAGQLRFVQALALGGKANTVGRTDTAYVHRTAQFTLNWTVGTVDATPVQEDRDAARAWIKGGFDAVDPFSLRETYQNYIDPELRDWKTSYYAENYARLADIKRAYDPNGFFCFAQAIQ
ncbi:FAD-binding oxidoreductase [Streptomyces kanamyceticus]|uniref:FAD-binding oxidoreductase n=1 Tax=Streptomyces kanamyceticus TaxID=1967 RepID=A0A5J6GMZ5_STRKN|nr:FAD-binding oxidoreductase [Streptomyces kanamyceticus]QEU95754.1 FAD-binding oxidoreductase [Streptomyces kanamyceticus]